MTRRSGPTTKLDACNFDPACPFDCPLQNCVLEYPGGIDSYLKDKEFLDHLKSGLDVQSAGAKMGLSPSAAERRYIHATNFASYQAKSLQTA